jgi:glc operon protein GlcG
VLLALLTIPLVAPAAARAQGAAPDELTLARAQSALRAADAEARRQGWAVVIAVVDLAGELMVFQRADDVQHASIDLAIGKARTAARFRRPTRALAESVAQGRVGFLGVPGVVPLEGGIPIILSGKVVGAVGVSGMTGQQDGQVAEAGARAAVQ